jgi:type IV pilus assembly protein PilW
MHGMPMFVNAIASDTDTMSAADDRGVTLVELMIGVTITVLIVAAGMAILTVSDKATRANDETVDTQQNVRTAMEFLSRDLKQAGFGPFDPAQGAVGGCTNAVMPKDNVPTGADRGPDRISLVVPVGNPTGTALDPPWVFAADTTVNMGTSTVIAMSSAAVVSTMATAAGGSLTGPQATLSVGGAFTGKVTGVGGANLTMMFNGAPIESPMRKNTPVFLLQCITYQIIPPPDATNLCSGRAPCLVRGVAGGVDVTGNPECTAVGSTVCLCVRWLCGSD